MCALSCFPCVLLGLVLWLGKSVLALPSPQDSAANPIASQYPFEATGTFNGTIIILPLQYSIVRSIVPSEYALLPIPENLFPDFPSDCFPVILEAGEDVDVTVLDLPGLSFQNVRMQVPFVDLLHDGFSPFQYGMTDFQPLFVTANAATALYGIGVALSRFDPPGEPYASSASAPQAYSLDAYPIVSTEGDGTPALVSTLFVPFADGESPAYPPATYENVTNQPMFGNGVTCDKQDRMFNTLISSGMIFVKGNVTIAAPYLPTTTTFTNVQGLRADTAFVEHNYQSCSQYEGV